MGYGLVLLDGNVVNINKLKKLNVQKIDRYFRVSLLIKSLCVLKLIWCKQLYVSVKVRLYSGVYSICY